MRTLISALLLGIAAVPGISGGAEPGPSATPTPPNVSAPSPSNDGGVTMSVGAVDCNHPAPTGEYCYVTVNLANISDGIPLFAETDQLAYDVTGRAFHPDAAAGAAANRGRPITQRLGHGAVTSGILVFSMPVGDRISRVVLHGKTGTPGEIFAVTP